MESEPSSAGILCGWSFSKSTRVYTQPHPSWRLSLLRRAQWPHGPTAQPEPQAAPCSKARLARVSRPGVVGAPAPPDRVLPPGRALCARWPPSPSSPCGFPGPLVPMCSPTAWPCPQPPDRAQQDSRRHRALALRSGELCDRHTSASAALQRPRPAASAQAPRGRVAAGLLQSRGHPHEHLLHLHTRSTRALRLPALSPRPRSAARPHFRHFSASASDVQTAPR